MNAITEKKARLLDLMTSVLELTRDGKRDIDEISEVFQKIKDNSDFIKEMIVGIKLSKSTIDLLLEFVGTATIPVTTEKFVARDKFVVDTSNKAKVKISYIGNNFKAWFLDKIENPKSETRLFWWKLKKSSVDKPILAELGGETKVETTLSEIYGLMEKQPNGENGILLINSYANIFYVEDISTFLRAVYVRWGGDGWFVHASSVGRPDAWGDGRLVFSRNS